MFAVIVGVVWFVDWSSVKDKLSFSDTGEPIEVALTSLNCDLEGGELGSHGLWLPRYAMITGSVENLSEEPLRLSVRIDYVWRGRNFVGKRIESVDPSPLAHNETGSFSFKEYITGFPEDTQCMVQLYENDDEQPIPFEDKTS